MTGKPIDFVLAVVPTLNASEIARLKDAIGLHHHPCAKAGHKFKILDKYRKWSSPFRITTRLFCQGCGTIREV